MSRNNCKYDCDDWLINEDGDEDWVCKMDHRCEKEQERENELTDLRELTDRLDDYRSNRKELPVHVQKLTQALILAAEYAEEFGWQRPASEQYASVTKAEFEQIRDDATLLYMMGLKESSDAATYYDDHSVKLLFERSKQLYYKMSAKEKAVVLLLNNDTPSWME